MKKKKKNIKKNNIDTSKWNENFRQYFNVRINQSPIKKYAERIKYYIKEDYSDFDELIKSIVLIKYRKKK